MCIHTSFSSSSLIGILKSSIVKESNSLNTANLFSSGNENASLFQNGEQNPMEPISPPALLKPPTLISFRPTLFPFVTTLNLAHAVLDDEFVQTFLVNVHLFPSLSRLSLAGNLITASMYFFFSYT